MKHLTGGQLQRLIDRYNLAIDLEEGVVVASRKDGKPLEPATVAKMVGLSEVPANWKKDGKTVRGI